MSAKIVAFSAVVATASAFAPTAGFAPRLRATGATGVSMSMDKSAYAPVITIFDHRGCSRTPKESTGATAGGQDDEMMVKIKSSKIVATAPFAEKVLQASLATLKN
eukprot:CAMPEP_0181347910 /NCGR_PEP_ID=MMETSP1101-20121128/34126_1 /TAXON_ID=46948 /ORGANISM="Rhodomonas abbreviata, Strain Caron Lab Isolate" /LENGTH=105 /DNA_ID=CAMNT_0023460147 /DNA_START=22 /DNA_END=339 /DNA_ORIENTATION=-